MKISEDQVECYLLVVCVVCVVRSNGKRGLNKEQFDAAPVGIVCSLCQSEL